MRLIRGTPGSGKTRIILQEFKDAMRQGLTGLRIVVPTATMVRHFRHELARDGVVFPPSCVVSLNRFAAERAPEHKLVPDGLLTAIVRDCLERINPVEFAEVSRTEGMLATVIETIALFENAGCTPDKLVSVRRLPPHARAFERVWRAACAAIAASGFCTRVELIRAAAACEEPLHVWIDGFSTISPLESEFVRSLSHSCDLTLTLDDSPAADDIRKLVISLGAMDRVLPASSRKPRTTVVEARSPEREADDIARRIIALNSEGIPFRQIGIALRDTALYLPLLRTTFNRFGIPARFYFSDRLQGHPVAEFLGGLVTGALTGWDFEATIETLRAHPKWGRSADFDRFDFAVREAMPGRAANALLTICESEWLAKEIAACLKTEAWKSERQTPGTWVSRLERLATELYRPGTLEAPRDHDSVAIERSHAAALRSWIATIESVVLFWPDPAQVITLQEFWRVASGAVESGVVSSSDDRGEVVHVMSAWEARQWDLRVLFVCGTADRDFPKRHPQNLLFPDHQIDPLHRAGIPLRKAFEQEQQEYGLFQSLRTRATEGLYFTFPIHDASGKTAQRSRFLESDLVPEPAVNCLPAGDAPDYAGAAEQIHRTELLAGMADIHRSISLTALEDLAQCQFKFFGCKTLSLKAAPDRPGERLQPRVTGSILHEALDRWLTDKSQDFVGVFERVFDEACRRQHIPPGYRLEVERIQFREIAERVSANERWHPDESLSEVKLTLDFPGGVTVNCRIDRIDRFGTDCVIVDYKSSKTARVEELVESRVRLQGPLYALAVRERLNLNPVAVLYWAVREDGLFGWGQLPDASAAWREMPANWATDARMRIIERLSSFLSGAVKVHPEEKDKCQWCDFRTACRVGEPAARHALIGIEGLA